MAAKLTVKRVVDALMQSHGLIAVAARSLGCDRKTIYNYRDQYPEVAEAIVGAREFVTDTAEQALFSAIQGRQPWAVCFYLKTQGRDRGYTEKTEHTGEFRVTVAYEDSASATTHGPGYSPYPAEPASGPKPGSSGQEAF
jgi:hypothetical protein